MNLFGHKNLYCDDLCIKKITCFGIINFVIISKQYSTLNVIIYFTKFIVANKIIILKFQVLNKIRQQK